MNDKYEAMERSVRAEMDLDNKDKKIEKLEAFMCAVAKEVGCLPSFADPSPDGGNLHIMRKIATYVKNTESSNH